MSTKARWQCVPSYNLLTHDQIQDLHRATLEVLETVGVQVQHEEGLQLLRDAGCRIKNGHTAQIPNWLVEEAIQSAPSRITIYSQRGQEAMCLEGRNTYFGLGTDLITTIDLRTGKMRPSVLQDVVNAARVTEKCQEIDFVASYALPHDVPTNTMYIECFKAQLENSTKPIFFTAAGSEDLAVMIQMAQAVAGGPENLREKPFLVHYSEPTPPLFHSQGAVSKLFLCAQEGVPVNYTPATLMGGSGPVTLAGGIVQANAEALSGLVLHQLKAKGAPIISGFAVPPMDMLASTPGYCTPEFRLTHSACADLYHYYGIPMWGTAGAAEAHCLDPQAGAEWGISMLTAALDGCNLIHDVGYMGQGLVGSPAALVMCNELIGFVRRMLRGFEINRDTLALDPIRNVGPGGTYLSEEHTLRHYRNELWRPRLLNRDNPDVWEKKGSQSVGEIATQRAIEILETFTPDPLPAKVQQTLDALLRQAEIDLAGKHFVA